MSNQGHYITAAAVATVGAIGGAYYAYKAYTESRRTKLPEKWRQVGTLKELFVYPIKSCGPVVVTEAECTILGLQDGWLRDRFLMVVDDKNNFITARVYPELLFVIPTVRNSVLTLNYRDMEPLHVNLAEVKASQKPKTAHVWSVPVPVLDCGSEASKWFSKILERASINFRLVYYAARNSRKMMPSMDKFYKFTKNDTGTLGDEAPFHLINEASLDDLNTRLKDCKVSTSNFRPNFLLTGPQPYDEDQWKFVKIGDNVFEIIKPCLRCILTTINTETGVRDSKTEPLETLRSYRQVEDPVEKKFAGNAPRMGLQIALRTAPGGRVTVGDPIYVA